ncbi:uroporphyrinogen decarboxylase [Chryseobacterium shandongense]|uniref:Uroporphyrinogen decarboxylase n=1 Tax=Chryseobacterium shandongense TaxID=1493872 RepID=A0A3G6QCS8_9FLAO|nr:MULTISPECIES: uroporphyrinogen decarboxylase [Chryseobacterium]AZA55741.1 uroporphyrinogen decarboxylase [Chryseobacterium shandongense]AZA87545.1 uroporphyrinogen decarboxylase [Chryseobacterium shandongense]AZA96046.1 uroporphyrinogen decarboxylase [Chryseobacterium shandongense]
MNPETAAYIGYSASLFIVLSFILKDVRKIRIVNMIGCICFVIYGIFNGMLWPVIIPNGLICFIQIYYLLFDKNKK